MQEDPLERVNLAGDPQYRAVLLEHRRRLSEFAELHRDALVQELLANEVEPRPFEK